MTQQATGGGRDSRRRFLRTSTASALGVAVPGQVTSASVASASAANAVLRVGLIGCGSRGTSAAVQALRADRGARLVAMADLFDDQLQKSLNLLQQNVPQQVQVSPERRFLGFDAYQKVMDADVDVVLLTSLPAFRPRHLQAAVEAGKHAFVEITTAIDAPGVRSVLKSSQLARQRNLAIVSGFCWRYDPRLRATVAQIRQGAIGQIRALYSTYYRSRLSHKFLGPRKPHMSDLEWQIRDWYGHLWLSGDVTLLLSGGHSVDKMSWFLNDEPPIKAVATGSRVFEADQFNTFDNGFVAYEYANGMRGFLGCRTQSGCHTENADYVIGTTGVCTIGRGRAPFIQGETNWQYRTPRDRNLLSMYQVEQNELFASIREGKPINDGTRMAHTTLIGILGRMAAYTGQEVTWEQALNSQQQLVPDDLGWQTKLEAIPLAVPGVTRLI